MQFGVCFLYVGGGGGGEWLGFDKRGGLGVGGLRGREGGFWEKGVRDR